MTKRTWILAKAWMRIRDSDDDYKRDSDEQEIFEEMLARLTGAGVKFADAINDAY